MYRVGEILWDGMYIQTLVYEVNVNNFKFLQLYSKYSYCCIYLKSFIHICSSVLELELEKETQIGQPYNQTIGAILGLYFNATHG